MKARPPLPGRLNDKPPVWMLQVDDYCLGVRQKKNGRGAQRVERQGARASSLLAGVALASLWDEA